MAYRTCSISSLDRRDCARNNGSRTVHLNTMDFSMTRSVVFLGLSIALLAGCEAEQPLATKTPAAKSAASAPPASDFMSPTNPDLASAAPASIAPQTVPPTNFSVPAAPLLPPASLPAQLPVEARNDAVQIVGHEIVDSIEIGPGNVFEPESGEIIVWLRLAIKGIAPLTVDLSTIKLMADGTKYDVRGVGFSGADPSVQYLIDPAIMQSGKVTTSGPAIGEVVYDTGAKQVTFHTLPSGMSLIFLVPSMPTKMSLEGLPGGAVPLE